MEWTKEVGSHGGVDGGWRNDFPLSHDLPGSIGIDCAQLRLPIHPMLAVRLRVFVDWHRQRGRDVVVIPPSEQDSYRVFKAMKVDPFDHGEDADTNSILPVTRLAKPTDAEEVAEKTREILEYQLTDLSSLGQATFMAVAELCDNALDHGRNAQGAYVAVRRVTEPRKQVSIAISDLGLGIPEHIRQRYPEWAEDGYAIAHAVQPHITGTGDRHRGIGFSEVFDAALTTSLHAGKMDIHSANGFFRQQLVQGTLKPEVVPAANFKRGTWITYDLGFGLSAVPSTTIVKSDAQGGS